ncbi:MAG: Ig-like domain-containing protein [Roseiflexus sp.]|nr:Ig-like domain-containing protein [Roseiflexus sp.]
MARSYPRLSAALRLLLALTLALLVAGAFVAPQRAAATSTIITQWTFNSPMPDNNTATGTTAPAIGSGTASLVGGATASFASGDADGGSTDPATGDDSAWNTTNYAPQGTGDRARGVQFAVSTVGYQNIRFSFDIRHSNTAANTVALLYSTDGGVTFAEVTTFVATAGETWFSTRAFDFGSIPALNNNPNVVFRIVAAFASSSSGYVAANPTSNYTTIGTLRFDMVTVRGDPLGSADAAPAVASTSPVNGAIGVPVNANIIVTFSEPVIVTPASFTLVCTTSGNVAATLSGSGATYTLDPAITLAAGETCTVTVLAANVSDIDAIDPPDTMTADFVFSFTVQSATGPCAALDTPIN